MCMVLMQLNPKRVSQRMEVQSHNLTYEMEIGNNLLKSTSTQQQQQQRVANLHIVYTAYIGDGSDGRIIIGMMSGAAIGFNYIVAP